MDKITEDSKIFYQCDECGFKYDDQDRALKCENWCKEHQSCNLEIISHGSPGGQAAQENR